MKINKAKLLVGTLAVVATAATVGSISGTVAWFQYSTRVTAAYQGATAHCSENLQIRLYKPASGNVAAVSSDWKQDLARDDITTFLSSVRGSHGNNLTPVTSGKLAANSVPSKLYRNPIYQYAKTSSWGEADATDYVDLPLQFRVLDVDGKTTETYLAKPIYLTDLTLAAKAADYDITSALRIVVDNKVTGTNAFAQTFSATGVSEVTVGGELDLNNDKAIDKTAGYEWDTTRTNVKYGDWTTGETPTAEKAYSQPVGSANLATADTDLKIADDSEPFDITGKPLLTTSTLSGEETGSSKTDWAGITIRIYLEGWTTLTADKFGNETKNATPTTVWDATKVLTTNVGWNVGMRFTAEAHADH